MKGGNLKTFPKKCLLLPFPTASYLATQDLSCGVISHSAICSILIFSLKEPSATHETIFCGPNLDRHNDKIVAHGRVVDLLKFIQPVSPASSSPYLVQPSTKIS